MAASASQVFLSLLVLLLVSSSNTVRSATVKPPSPAPPIRPLVGGWSPIKNVKDPIVQEIAKFAIEEHFKQTGERLVYVRVVSGETQVVAGKNYKLVIRARTGHGRSTYEATVWDQPWTKKRVLVNFGLVA